MPRTEIVAAQLTQRRADALCLVVLQYLTLTWSTYFVLCCLNPLLLVISLLLTYTVLRVGACLSNIYMTEPEYGDLLKSPGIDSQPRGPVRQPYLSFRPARLHRLAESIPVLHKRL